MSNPELPQEKPTDQSQVAAARRKSRAGIWIFAALVLLFAIMFLLPGFILGLELRFFPGNRLLGGAVKVLFYPARKLANACPPIGKFYTRELLLVMPDRQPPQSP